MVTAAAAGIPERLRHVNQLLTWAREAQGKYASCLLPALEELADCVALLAGPATPADAGPRFLGRDDE